MISYDLGTAITKLMSEYTVTDSTQSYDRGVLTEVLDVPYTILALVHPEVMTEDQVFEPNSARVEGNIAVFTKTDLDLDRKDKLATIIEYKGQPYKLISQGDWSNYNYYEYKGELVVPEATG